MSRLSSKPTTVKKKTVVLWGQLSKVSANLPGRAAPARRHGGTQLMSRTNYEAVSDYVGHWLHRAQCLAFDRFFRSNRVSHIVAALLPKIPWCGPGAGLAFKVTHGL